VDGRWVGANTDAAGFLSPLRGHISLTGLRVAVLGAGGAARAVTAALGSSGCCVTVYARNPAQAARLADQALLEVAPWPPEPGSWDVLVNCTPIGMYPRVDDTPLPANQLSGRYVYDLVYNPSPTRLLREAAAAGCETIDGLDMLVAQAQEQFLWWTGTRPSAGVMRDAARKQLSEFVRDENYVV
jgi:3-dehydroquinate dehydratase/shikimate dehydrogenase